MSAFPDINDILCLQNIHGIGAGRMKRLLQVFGNADAAGRASMRRLTQIPGIDRDLARRIRNGPDPTAMRQQLHIIRTRNIECLTCWDKRYPPLLKACSDSPVMLFCRGTIPVEWPLTLGVVGTRVPTPYGRQVTAGLVRDLVLQQFCIASGFARGIDTIAHDVALQLAGKTIAVLGCGVDHIYPAENRALFRRLCESGLVISEYLPGTGPDAVNFPRRNRIISGLSRGVLIIEAGRRSGALITGGYALEQNREVFAVPGNINSPASAGSNRLIQQGAKLVQTLEDILEELPGFLGKSKTAAPAPVPANLPEEVQMLLRELSHTPVHIDQLVLNLQDSPASILARLLRLELQGLVLQLSGKYFVRNQGT